ncbi:uncharacterized protein LOC116305581 [Actinia tenebrosa]|uniref:Uncharacterized protein LOC116305581 n=1 Tax=Actinia tenebrosa TaxID=6105 RepID=A0A6P8J0A0_ACTTE|nr:uncharacterized protein LOC116305581 [Actinia tenebrosa]
MKTSLLISVIILQSLYAAFSLPLETKSIELVERECKDNRDDCNWIANNHYDVPKYCWAHRNDAFIKDCPKYCGFCKQPAPPQVFECEDTRDDCSWIAEHNNDVAAYCDRHRNDAFIKKCQKTCGFCKAPAPPIVCEDTRSDCDWINRNGENKESYCARNRNDPAVRECAKTCGFCKAPAPPEIITCEDTRDDCSWIAEHNDDVAAYCDRHRNDAFIKQCQRTCGYCKAPAPPKLACEDTRRDCDTINHIGEPKTTYCARNRNDPAVRECAKTCGFC